MNTLAYPMNSAPFAAPPSSLSASQAYRQVHVSSGVLGASPHGLVTMLFDGLIESLHRARAALKRGDVAAKSAALSRAVRILDEGLKATLDPAGGDITRQLESLYGYASLRLTRANLHSDAAMIQECERLIAPVREAWVAIRPQVDSVPARG